LVELGKRMQAVVETTKAAAKEKDFKEQIKIGKALGTASKQFTELGNAVARFANILAAEAKPQKDLIDTLQK